MPAHVPKTRDRRQNARPRAQTRAGRQNARPRAQTRAQSNELLENQISKKRLQKEEEEEERKKMKVVS